MKGFILFCLFLLREGNADDREPKFFFGPKIQTVVSYKRIPEFITEFVPSSCVVIEPTLLPCRHVRNLQIYPSVPTRITKTQTPQIHNHQEQQKWKPPVQSSEPVHHRPTPPLRLGSQQVKNPSAHWNWNLFNIFRVENITYTTTKTEYVTTRVEDPNSVVSFYIRGCRPSRLPFNLAECPKPQVQQGGKRDEGIVVMAPLKFVSGDSLIVPSKPEKDKEEEDIGKEEEEEKEKEKGRKGEPDENQTAKSEK